MSNPIVFDQQPQDQIEFPKPGVTSLVPASSVEDRTAKYHIALGEDSPGMPQIKQQLETEGEQRLRFYAAQKEQAKRHSDRLDVVSQILKTGQLDQTQQDLLFGLSDEQVLNPDTILEEQFAKRAHELVLSHPEIAPDTQKAMASAYDSVNIAIDLHNEYAAKYQILNKLHEDDQFRQSQRSYGSHAEGIAKSLIPMVSTLREVGVLGPNKQDTYQRLWMLPPSEFNIQVKQMYDQLMERGGEDQASAFLTDLYGYSNNREFTDQIWKAVDIASALPIGAIAKYGIRGLRELGATAKIEKLVPESTSVAEAIVKHPKVKAEIKKSPIPMTAEVDESATFSKEADVPFNEGDQTLYSIKRVKSALRNVSKALNKPGVKANEVLDAAGLTEDAAQVAVADYADRLSTLSQKLKSAGPELEAKLSTEYDKLQMERLSREIPTMFNPTKVLEAPGHLSALRQQQLRELMERADMVIARATGQQFVVRRAPDAAQTVGYKQALDRLMEDTGGGLHDFHEVLPENTVGNVGKVVATFTKRSGKLFDTPQSAKQYAKRTYGFKDSVVIKPYGGKYVIQLEKTIDETTPEFRAEILTDNETPRSTALSFLKRLYTGGKEIHSEFQVNQRGVAVHSSQALNKLIHELSDTIQPLSGRKKAALQRVMEANRDFIDPLTGKRGEFYKNVGELEKAYVSHNNRLPSPEEVSAYYAAVKLNDLDYILRNVQMYSALTREGYENVTLLGKTFAARKLDNIPWNDKLTAGIMVHDGKANQFFEKGHMSAQQESYIDELISKHNYSLIQVANPTDAEVQGLFKITDDVNFVLTKEAVHEPLNFKQLPYDPGGHVIYKDPFFIKQPRMYHTTSGRRVHVGDVAVANAKNEAQAREFAESFEQGRQLLGDEPALARHLHNRLPYTVGEFKSKFFSKNAAFDPKTPFTYTHTGQSTADAGVKFGSQTLKQLYPDMHSAVTSPYNMWAKLNKDFLGERQHNIDLPKNTGTESNPMWVRGAPRLIDPLKTMAKALQDLSRNRHYQQYQISAAESFIQEFGDLMKNKVGQVGIKASQHTNPIVTLQNAEFSGDYFAVARAKQVRNSVLRLLSEPSEYQRSINATRMKLMDWAYNKFGDGKTYNVIDNISATALPLIKDPWRYARAMAFHLKLGFFNPVQIFVQGQTLANILAISNHGGKGFYSAILMRQLGMTAQDSVIKHYAEVAEKLGMMSRNEFEDSHRWLRETGFDVVGREHAWRDDVFDDNLFRGKLGHFFLDKGPMFFNGTERMVRVASWNAAYLEAIREGGLKAGKLTLRDAQKIMTRAQDLSGNMSKDASSWWQSGPTSSFSQFLGYQARMFELLTGKRLTGAQRFKLGTVMAGMYGLSATGAVTPGFDFSEDIRAAALARGINLDEGALSVITNGVPASLMAFATGEMPNYGERYGPGNDLFRNLYRNFKDDNTLVDNFASTLELINGASGSIMGDVLKGLVPFGDDLITMMSERVFSPATFALDAVEVARPISVANNAVKLVTALNTGLYMTRNGQTLTEVSKTNAWVYAITGMQPKKITELYTINLTNADFTQQQAELSKSLAGYARKWLEATDRGDSEGARIHRSQMDTTLKLMKVSPQHIAQVLSSALTDEPRSRQIILKYIKNGAYDGTAEDRARLMQEKGYK